MVQDFSAVMIHITLKSKRKVYCNIVKVKGKDTTNLTKIANAFNNSFI